MKSLLFTIMLLSFGAMAQQTESNYAEMGDTRLLLAKVWQRVAVSRHCKKETVQQIINDSYIITATGLSLLASESQACREAASNWIDISSVQVKRLLLAEDRAEFFKNFERENFLQSHPTP